MGLPVPTPGQDPGPDYATNEQSSFNLIDAHNHSAGKGVPINPNGLNINADLPIGSNNLTLVKTVNFQAQPSSLAGFSPNLGCLYVAGNELCYNDKAGNVVPITNNGSVNAGAGSITGLPSGTASASYSSGSGTFVWKSATNTPANTDTGSVIFRNILANSKGITVSPPNALGSDYSLVWPLVPGTTSLVSLDTSGNFGTTMTAALANSVGSAMTATGANAVANSRTRTLSTTVSAGGVALSSSCSAFSTGSASPVDITNLSVTITTTGRPVYLALIDDANGTNASSIEVQGHVSPDVVGAIYLLNGSTVITNSTIASEAAFQSATLNIVIPVSSISMIDTSVNGAAGTYTYKAQAAALTSSTATFVSYAKLIAYEI